VVNLLPPSITLHSDKLNRKKYIIFLPFVLAIANYSIHFTRLSSTFLILRVKLADTLRIF